ncbi:MAG: thiol:disulfide interchange protein DsbA/DsbL [Gammaproteobacteria bacterium]|nr:thiol:disulfide interchange protein DsbA/DsbL [Gammaproteobacteria bacterium]
MSKTLMGIVLLGSLLGTALPAVAVDITGKYETITPAQPTADKNRVEVVEIFSYACPHCFSFLPVMERLEKDKADYVDIKHMPAIFRKSWEVYAKAFYTAELLGVLDKTHHDLFVEIHNKGKPMNTPEALRNFFTERGVSAEQFDKTFDSFAVDTKLRQSKVMQGRYGISGTPTVVVNGKYRVSGSTAGSYDNVIAVINALAEQEHKAIMAAK